MINKIGLVMGIIGLILSIIWGAMYYNERAETRDLKARTEESLAAMESAAKHREDSITLEIKKRDSLNQSLIKAQKEAKESLNEAVKLSKALSSDLRRAKADRDTVKYYAKCDSLADQVIVLEAENSSYQSKVDLLNISYRKQLADKDSLLASRGRLYAELRQSYSGSILREDQLKEDKTKLELKLQKSRRTTRLVALIGGAVAGAVYLSTR